MADFTFDAVVELDTEVDASIYPVTVTDGVSESFALADSEDRLSQTSDSISLEESYSLPSQFGRMAEQVRLRDKFTVVGQPLAGNRSNAFTTR